MKLRAKNRLITIHEIFEADLPRVWADERAIRQIALNLLSNAIKFTPQGGEIWIKVGWTASGGQYFSVKDTGPGIPEDEIPVVLASFGQGSNAIKSAEQGAGLGLPIAKSLVDLHGGTFTLKSKLRVGTEVDHRAAARARDGGARADERALACPAFQGAARSDRRAWRSAAAERPRRLTLPEFDRRRAYVAATTGSAPDRLRNVSRSNLPA